MKNLISIFKFFTKHFIKIGQLNKYINNVGSKYKIFINKLKIMKLL